ncbi:hypothetical protein ACIQWI_08175 [Peribacillus frigoritolerans]
MTTLTSWVDYKWNSDKVISVLNSGASVRNWNPGVSISEDIRKPWKTSTRAYGQTIFKGSMVWKGTGVRTDKKQTVWGNNKGKQGGSIVKM